MPLLWPHSIILMSSFTKYIWHTHKQNRHLDLASSYRLAAPPGQLLQQSVCITKELLQGTISEMLICMVHVLIGVVAWLQYGVGRRMPSTTNTGVFYCWFFWMHRATATRSWRSLLCHSSTATTSCCNVIMKSPMRQRSVHGSWKLKTSQFLHGLHTHPVRCHPVSMFGMFWIGSDIVLKPMKRSGPALHRPLSTTWSAACEGDVWHGVRQMMVTPDKSWEV